MDIQIDEAAKAAIIRILSRGNNAVVRRKGREVVVIEEKRKTVYDPSPNRR